MPAGFLKVFSFISQIHHSQLRFSYPRHPTVGWIQINSEIKTLLRHRHHHSFWFFSFFSCFRDQLLDFPCIHLSLSVLKFYQWKNELMSRKSNLQDPSMIHNSQHPFSSIAKPLNTILIQQFLLHLIKPGHQYLILIPDLFKWST